MYKLLPICMQCEISSPVHGIICFATYIIPVLIVWWHYTALALATASCISVWHVHREEACVIRSVSFTIVYCWTFIGSNNCPNCEPCTIAMLIPLILYHAYYYSAYLIVAFLSVGFVFTLRCNTTSIIPFSTLEPCNVAMQYLMMGKKFLSSTLLLCTPQHLHFVV